MITWDEAQTTCQDLTNDTTTGSLTFFKRIMNVGYKYVLADLDRPVIELTRTASTVASQQYYQLPPDYLYLRSVTVTVGGTVYPVQEIEDQETWDIINSTSGQTSDYPDGFFIRPGFGISGAEIGFYPLPSSSGNTITVVYAANDKDMSSDEYTTGTVSVTEGSATVTGSGTTFTSAMVGRYFKVDTDPTWYRVASFTSTTEVVLENVYEGSTAAGAAYTIAEAFSLPEELQILPVYYAVWHYFSSKRDERAKKEYEDLFFRQLELGKIRHSSKTSGSIVRPTNRRPGYRRSMPFHFPNNVSGS